RVPSVTEWAFCVSSHTYIADRRRRIRGDETFHERSVATGRLHACRRTEQRQRFSPNHALREAFDPKTLSRHFTKEPLLVVRPGNRGLPVLSHTARRGALGSARARDTRRPKARRSGMLGCPPRRRGGDNDR